MYSPDQAHDQQFSCKPLLAFDENKDYLTQKEAVRKKLLQCLGDMPGERCDLNPRLEYTLERETFTETRVLLTFEEGIEAPVLICIPKVKKEKYPVAICLQGHGTGSHVSLGRTLEDEAPDEGDRDIALQALAKGFAAVVFDQRGMGNRRSEKVENKEDHGRPRCHITAMNALLLGKTLIGERCWDVSRVIDYIETLPQLDSKRIVCLGNSGGGTATYYAAAFDERITAAMPSCSVCSYKDSIAAMHHCQCNFIPGIAKYMDMGEIALAIAPRPLIVIRGLDDPIFPKKGVDEVYQTIEKIYKAEGHPQNCALVNGPFGHRFYKDLGWAKFDEVVGWK